MLADWMSVLRRGLSPQVPADRAACDRALIRILRPYVTRHGRPALIGALAVLLSTAAALAPPLILRELVDDVIAAGRVEAVTATVLALGACMAAAKALRLAEEFCFAKFQQLCISDLQSALVTHVLKLPKPYFDRRATGGLTRSLTEDLDQLRFLFSGTLANVLGQALRLLGGLILLVGLEWRLALSVLGVLPLLLWGLRYFSRRVFVLSRRRLEQQADASGHLQEALSGIVSVKAAGNEEGVGAQLKSRFDRLWGTTLEQTVVGSVGAVFLQSVPGIGRALALGAGALLVARGEWTLGSLLAFQVYLGDVFGPAQFLSSVTLQLQSARASLQRIGAVLGEAPEDAGGERRPTPRLRGEIELRGVSFAYPESEPVLSGIRLHVQPGEAVAVTGPSGVGKTTLACLMLGFYRPACGEILCDGRPIGWYDLRSLRRRIGYVPQRPVLASGSVLDNLRFGSPHATTAELVAAARAAAVHEEILALADGYRTDVGEGGLRLSDGQRHRIALARALLKNPDVLILDEPTAALDGTTERTLIAGVRDWRRARTLIVITHRPSTARLCERALRLHPSGVDDIDVDDVGSDPGTPLEVPGAC
jgi:ABC-type bacteriocin/lantibiotic exporter with double-glycine peptidase domain